MSQYKRVKCCFVLGYLVYMGTVLGIITQVYYGSLIQGSQEIEEVDIQNMLQVFQDWQTPFISDIRIVASWMYCHEEEIPNQPKDTAEWVDLLIYPWYGFRHSLHLEGEGTINKCLTFSCSTTRLNPFPMVQANVFGGQKVCGLAQKKRDGYQADYLNII